MSRGRLWIDALAGVRAVPLPDGPASVVIADAPLGAGEARYLAIVPNPLSPAHRARSGEMGIDEGYGLAAAIVGTPRGSALVAVVDVPGQAFGLREEADALQRSLAASVSAYVAARERGPVLALIVGRAISGAFLAHGLQASWLGALRDPALEVHVMSAPSVARVSRSNAQEVARIAQIVPATARDIETFAGFGALDVLFDVRDADAPSDAEVARVRDALARAAADPAVQGRRPVDRLSRGGEARALSRQVRERLARDW